MGMFDSVVIEGLKLPKLPKEVNDFIKKSGSKLPNDYQTKDLDNVLSTYTINDKGQIYVYEYKPTGKKVPYRNPFEGWVDNRSFLERLYHKIRSNNITKQYPELKFVDERKQVKVKTKLTNTFVIYSYKEFNGRYLDISFEVKAVDGKVEKITFKHADIESEKDAQERKNNQTEFEANLARSIQERKDFRSQWYYPILKEVYNPFVFFSTKLIQAGCNALIKLTYRWRGV